MWSLPVIFLLWPESPEAGLEGGSQAGVRGQRGAEDQRQVGHGGGAAGDGGGAAGDGGGARHRGGGWPGGAEAEEHAGDGGQRGGRGGGVGRDREGPEGGQGHGEVQEAAQKVSRPGAEIREAGPASGVQRPASAASTRLSEVRRSEVIRVISTLFSPN